MTKVGGIINLLPSGTSVVVWNLSRRFVEYAGSSDNTYDELKQRKVESIIPEYMPGTIMARLFINIK